MTAGDPIGVVVGGALTKSLEVRLDPGRSAQLGQYVMTPLDDETRLLGMVTDVLLQSAESGATAWPPPAGDDPGSALLREVLLDTGVYTAIEVNPYLEVHRAGESWRARRLPRHFARVALADQDALDRAFDTGDRPAISLGTPLGMADIQVAVDLERLFERSAGIFGKSGTGKTVLALQLLDAMVANSARAATNRDRNVALIFDMHNDYGWGLKFQGDGGGERRSLKQRHPSDVSVYSLDEAAPNVDGRVVIGTRDIEPEDLAILQSTAYFTSLAVEASYELRSRFGRDWIDELMADAPSPSVVRRCGLEEGDEAASWARVAAKLGVASGSLDSLRRGLRRIVRREFVQTGGNQFNQVIDHIVQTLQGGKSVVIQFGAKHGSDLTSYMLVANMLSRRIWEEYRAAMEKAAGDVSKEPDRLVIVIEEAHKFIDRALAGQSIFGQIARELRKYNVTLLVIDQRPSQIDPEVLSQIGTRFCLQLDSEADVEALVSGMSGRSGLRQVIASLESKQQALVFGHALPMPVVVRPPDLTRDYAPGASLRTRLGAAPSKSAPPTPSGLYG